VINPKLLNVDYVEVERRMLAHTLEYLTGIQKAAHDLIQDVKSRHPGEELHCPLMRALDEALYIERDFTRLIHTPTGRAQPEPPPMKEFPRPTRLT